MGPYTDEAMFVLPCALRAPVHVAALHAMHYVLHVGRGLFVFIYACMYIELNLIPLHPYTAFGRGFGYWIRQVGMQQY